MIKRLHHVGVVVADLAAAETFVTQTLGLTVSRRLSLPDVAEIVFFECGGVELELIEVQDPEARRTRLGADGAVARIEHVALEVGDLTAAVASMSAAGVRFTAGAGQQQESDTPLVALGTRSLFTLPESSAGLIFQVIEPLSP